MINWFDNRNIIPTNYIVSPQGIDNDAHISQSTVSTRRTQQKHFHDAFPLFMRSCGYIYIFVLEKNNVRMYSFWYCPKVKCFTRSWHKLVVV